jgi:hypothetical protein
MSTQEQFSNNSKPSTLTTNTFKHIMNAYQIPAECVLCLDKLLKVSNIYSLVDFEDNGDIISRGVQFWHAYQKGFYFTVVVLELKTGDLLKRSHRLNDFRLPCNWIIVEYDFLNPVITSKEQLLKDFHDRQ